jgi:basic membrane protein A
MDLPIIQDFILGFKQGATTMVPDIEIQIIFIGNFDDAQKAYDLTRTAIENDANVVYNVAGPAGLGILKAAVGSDQNGIHPDNVIASMLKQIGNSIYNDTIVPEQVKAQIEAADAKVTSGEIDVVTQLDCDRTLYDFVDALTRLAYPDT